MLAELRHQLALVGEALAAAGRIGTPADDFFLDIAEVRTGLGARTLHEPVAARRREYGVHAVVGVPEATLRIATGALVTVDGAAGTVVVHPGGSATD